MAIPDGQCPTLLASLHAQDRAPLRLCFREPAASLPGTTLEAWQSFWMAEAQRVAQAMFDHLPGGLIDALLVEFCKRKANVFIVSSPEYTKEEPYGNESRSASQA